MAQDRSPELDKDAPPDLFSIVWVKMEVDEDGVVEGIDGLEHTEKQTDQDQDQETKSASSSGRRRKTTTPRKRKNQHLNELKCTYCDYRTSFKNALKYHEMNHTNPNPLSCELCDYTTKYPGSLQRHIIGQHKSKEETASEELPTFKCPDCPYTSIFKWNLAAHSRKHSVVKNFKCNLCDFSTAYKHSFVKHSRTHRNKDENQVSYQCDKCPFVTRYEGHISRHLAQIHKEVSAKARKCDHCEFSTKLRWRLNVHINRSRQETPLKCEFCAFVTDYNCEFKKHKLEHIGLHNKVIKETEFFTQYENCQPLGTKNENENQSDLPAGDGQTTEGRTDEPTLSSTNNLKNQFILDTENEEVDWRSIEVSERPGQEKPFQCTQCEYIARYKASVQRHFQRHHTSKDNRPYKCLKCDFSTKTRDQISLHNKRSQSSQLLSCSNCEFSTYFKCENVMHQKCHYPFKCKLCNYTCKQNFDIQRHYSMIHLGNGLKCRYCNFRSIRKETVFNHEMVHTGVKPFKCSICTYSATRRSLLHNHMRKFHSEKMPVIIDESKIDSLKRIDDRTESNEVILSESSGFMLGTNRVLTNESDDVSGSNSKQVFDLDVQKC